MSIPLNRCYTFLTYLEGDQTEGWKEDQLNQLFDKTVTRVPPIAETDDDLWVNLEKDFKEAFTNTNIKSDAYIDLKKLKQTDSLDKYISEFKRLVHLANVPIDQHSILETFKEGLHKGLVKSIINSHDYDPAVTWDFEQWTKATQKQHGKWKATQLYNTPKAYNTKREALKQYFKVGGKFGNQQRRGNNQGRCTTSQGGDAMDINYTTLSPDEKTKLIKTNSCFYYRKPGYRAAVCHKKARDRGMVPAPNTSTSNNSGGTRIRATDSGDQPLMKPKDFANFLKDNMDKFDEDTCLNLVDTLMPPHFQQAQN